MRNGRYNFNGKRVIISRTDSIGDVVLSLPVAAIFKRLFPQSTIIFLGKTYTLPVLKACEYIDEVVDWDVIGKDETGLASLNADMILHVFPRKEIAIAARKAGIPMRAGTRNRLYHWSYCNKLIRLSRRHSALHEAQLNLRLLVPFGAKPFFSQEEIHDLYGLSKIPSLSDSQRELLATDRVNLILHPGSRGSAREWGILNFAELIRLLEPEKFRIFITGSKEEGDSFREELLLAFPHVTDLCGTFDLDSLIAFIANCDALIAGSTGPLHLAAASGRTTIGLYPPIKPMHPGRWAPIGHAATYLVAHKSCSRCRKSGICSCMQEISPQKVRTKLGEFFT